MKILQVISYGYLAGGAEKSVLFLKEKLEECGHQVVVISSDHDKNSTAQRLSDVEFPEIDRPGTSLIAKAFHHLWYMPSYQAIKAMIAEFGPDIVHFHTMGQLSPSALFALGRVPGVLTVHGPEEYTTSILEWGLPQQLFVNGQVAVTKLTALGKAYYAYFRSIQRPIYAYGFRKHLKAMIAPSRYMAKTLEKERYGVPVHQLYNGIELPKSTPIKNRHRLLYVGRLEYVKGVDVLLKALPKVLRHIPNIHLSIVGDGTVRPELEAFVGRNRLQEHVTFHGWLDSRAVHKQYAETTAVVIPSIWPENLPTVCIEALASGRPVIGTDSGGIPELIQDEVTGRIVDKGDYTGLAKAIMSVLSEHDIETVARACAASMQDFTVATFVKNLEHLYHQVSDGSG